MQVILEKLGKEETPGSNYLVIELFKSISCLHNCSLLSHYHLVGVFLTCLSTNVIKMVQVRKLKNEGETMKIFIVNIGYGCFRFITPIEINVNIK